MLAKVLIAIAVLIALLGGVVAFAAGRPDTYHVERATEIAASPDLVFAQLDDFKTWAGWSPWDKLDPSMSKTFDGPARAVGASYAWQGNKDVGKGKMTITERRAPEHIAYRLEFFEPFASVAQSSFELHKRGHRSTSITWNMDGDNHLIGKVMGLFMDMDGMIGADFERGLAALKERSENAQRNLDLALQVIREQDAARAVPVPAAGENAEPQ